MKFILGYKPGTVSKVHPGPKVYFSMASEYKGKTYNFERLERNDAGVVLPRLRVYDTKDYPEEMLAAMFEKFHIVELVQEPLAKR